MGRFDHARGHQLRGQGENANPFRTGYDERLTQVRETLGLNVVILGLVPRICGHAYW